MMLKTLPVLMVLYGACSLFHFVHNATYIQDYPNLPAWITPVGVYVSWCVIAAVGVVGYWLYRSVSGGAGLFVIALYALFGFGGLDHYTLAPMGAHTLAMNASILAEVVAATLLLGYVAYSAVPVRGFRGGGGRGGHRLR
jgi:hypothetical protein